MRWPLSRRSGLWQGLFLLVFFVLASLAYEVHSGLKTLVTSYGSAEQVAQHLLEAVHKHSQEIHPLSDKTPPFQEEALVFQKQLENAFLSSQSRANRLFRWVWIGTAMVLMLHLLGYWVLSLEISETRRAHQRSEAALHEKSRFLAMMSHEIRTPLNAVLGMNRLLQETHLSEDQRELSDVACQAGEVLETVVNNVLDFSRLEAGRMDLSREPFEISALVGSVESILRPSAQTKGLKFYVDGPVGIGPVLGDAARLRQVLINLTHNAIKFTDRGTVTLRWEALESKDQAGRYRFSVRDTGVGIPEKQKDRIFEAFLQAEAGTLRASGGTGLGLTICQKLVELMGSRIEVESEQGKGSTFWFDVALPLSTAASAEPEPIEATAQRQASVEMAPKSRILLVEDNAFNRALAVRLLNRLTAVIDVACNGQEALQKFQQYRYDLILLDCQMPWMDGYQVAEEIRRREKSGIPRTPIVAMTAYALDGDREKCLASGMDDYLTKPVRWEIFLRMIQHWAPGVTEISGLTVEPVEACPVDLSLIREASAGNPAMLKQLVGSYFSQAEESLFRLEEAQRRNDVEEMRNAIHALSGTSSCFGALKVTQLLQDLREAVKSGNSTSWNQLIGNVRFEIEKLEKFMTEYLAKTSVQPIADADHRG